MTVRLDLNSYGKSAIRVFTVARRGNRHDVRDLTVSVRVQGAFEAAHIDGDNSAVLPTDTMKNTVYALAQAHRSSPLEAFALAVSERLLSASPAASTVTVEIEAKAWDRIRVGERPHDHAFARGSPAQRVARVERTRTSTTFAAGVSGMALLKSSGSAFSGFPRDDFTTLRDTRDRILATDIDAEWRYAGAPESFDLAWRAVRDALTETFADHASESVQHTLYAMGGAALRRCDDVAEIHIRMPNRHHLLVDLTPFGQDNRNDVFVAIEEPYGLIEATVRRAAPGG